MTEVAAEIESSTGVIEENEPTQNMVDPNISNTPASSVEPQAAPANWLDGLPEDLREEPNLVKFSELGTFAKSYMNLSKLVGRDKVPLPQTPFEPNAEHKDDSWEHVFNQLGRPDTPDGYKFGKLQLPEGIKFNQDNHKAFAGEMHRLGLSNEQANGLFEFYWDTEISRHNNGLAQSETETEQGLNGLKAEWGAAYDSKINIARNAVRNSQIPGLKEMLDGTGMGNNPLVIKLFADIGEKIMGDTQLIGGVGGNGNGRPNTPAEIDIKIAELQSSQAAFDTNHPKHKVVRKQITQLHRDKVSLRG